MKLLLLQVPLRICPDFPFAHSKDTVALSLLGARGHSLLLAVCRAMPGVPALGEVAMTTQASPSPVSPSPVSPPLSGASPGGNWELLALPLAHGSAFYQQRVRGGCPGTSTPAPRSPIPELRPRLHPTVTHPRSRVPRSTSRGAAAPSPSLRCRFPRPSSTAGSREAVWTWSADAAGSGAGRRGWESLTRIWAPRGTPGLWL